MITSFLRELEQVFGWLLAASWQASVLALFVLVIQRIFGSRLNPRWRYALWLLVLLRLVLPVLPASTLSLFQFAPTPPPQLVTQVTEPWQPLFTVKPYLSQHDAVQMVVPNYPFSYFTLLAVLWLAGAGILLVLTWEVNRRFARQIVNSPAISDSDVLELFTKTKAELGIRRPIRLVENEQVQSPAIMGLFRPTLLLPADVREKFDARELRFIFLHELAHLKRGDVMVQALIALLQILHWFNPFLWFAFRRMRIDREPATDALVLSRTGEEEKERYGLMLIKLLEHFNQRHSLPTLVGILEDKDQFKRRFSLIARFTRGAYGWSLLGLSILVVLSGLFLTKQLDIPKTKYLLQISRPAPGAEMTIESVVYGETSLDLVRAYGKFVGAYPPKDYYIRTTVGDTPNGPATGSMQWIFGMGTNPGDSADTHRFGLEIKSPPHSSPTLYWNVYFVKINGQSRTTEKIVTFTTPNPARQKPLGYQPAVPLPTHSDLDGLDVSFDSLETGVNVYKSLSPDEPPGWNSVATFTVSEKGESTNRYELLDLTISPNTGRQMTSDYAGPSPSNGLITFPIDGTLWPEDGPYVVDASFYRTTDFTPEEIYQLTDVRMPKPGEITPLGKEWNAFGASVNFMGVYGEGALLPPGLEKRASSPCIVFSIASDSSQALEDNWIQLSEQKSVDHDSKGAQRRRAERGNQIFCINLWDNRPEILNTFTFAMLHDRKEFAFTAQPTIVSGETASLPRIIQPAPTPAAMDKLPPIYVWFSKIGLGFFGPIRHDAGLSDNSHIPGTDHTISVWCKSFTKTQATLDFTESWPKGPPSTNKGGTLQPTGEKMEEVQIPLEEVHTFRIFDSVDVTTSPTLKPDSMEPTSQGAEAKSTETPNTPNQQAQTYLEVDYVETTGDAGMAGGLTTSKEAAQALIFDPKNRLTAPKLVYVPLGIGTNTVSFKKPSDVNWTVTVNWKDPLAIKEQDLTVKGEWLNANGGAVSYGAQFTAKLGPNECYVVTGPWKTKESSKIIIRYVEQPEKADAATKPTDASSQIIAKNKPSPSLYVRFDKNVRYDPTVSGFFGPVGQIDSDMSLIPGTNQVISVTYESFTATSATLLFNRGWPTGTPPTPLPPADVNATVEVPLAKNYSFRIFGSVDVTTSPTAPPPRPNMQTPLLMAIYGHNDEKINALIAKKEPIIMTDMEAAIEVGTPQEVKLLWENGPHFISEMAYAISQGASVSDLEKLLANGVPVERLYDPTITPLGVAARMGKVDVARWLLDHGANLHASRDPLDLAVKGYSAETVSFLLQKGAQFDQEPYPLNLATGFGDFSGPELVKKREAIINVLIKAGALKRMSTDRKIGLLIESCERKVPEFLKAYLDAGVNPLDKNSQGKTALDIVKESYGQKETNPAVDGMQPLIDILEAARIANKSTLR